MAHVAFGISILLIKMSETVDSSFGSTKNMTTISATKDGDPTANVDDGKEDILLFDPDRDDRTEQWVERRRKEAVLGKGEKMWFYRNEENKIFGPFSTLSMKQWYAQGYFPSDLPVISRDKGFRNVPTDEDTFIPLESLDPFPFVTLDKKRGVVVSCPSCFAVLSYDAKLRKPSKVDYASVSAVNCKVNVHELVELVVEKGESRRTRPISKVGREGQMHPLSCAQCLTEIGIYDATSKQFVFFESIPGH